MEVRIEHTRSVVVPSDINVEETPEDFESKLLNADVKRNITEMREMAEWAVDCGNFKDCDRILMMVNVTYLFNPDEPICALWKNRFNVHGRQVTLMDHPLTSAGTRFLIRAKKRSSQELLRPAKQFEDLSEAS